MHGIPGGFVCILLLCSVSRPVHSSISANSRAILNYCNSCKQLTVCDYEVHWIYRRRAKKNKKKDKYLPRIFICAACMDKHSPVKS